MNNTPVTDTRPDLPAAATPGIVLTPAPSRTRTTLTWVVLVGIGIGCVAVQSVAPLLSAIVVGLALGLAARPLALRIPGNPAARLAHANIIGGTVLRTGVALLGLRFTLRDLGSLGVRGVSIAAGTLVATFLVTRWVARRAGNAPEGADVMAAGFAVCGAAAATTMAGALAERDSDSRRRVMLDEFSAATIAMVCILGLVAVPLMLFLGSAANLSDTDTGLWFGAALPEVAHVVMAGDLTSPQALAIATIAKLLRVALLAPLVIVVTASAARRARTVVSDLAASGAGRIDQAGRLGRGGGDDRAKRRRPVPLFVIGFIACMGLATMVDLPGAVTDMAATVSTAMIAGAMIAIGVNLSIQALLRRWRTTGVAAVTGAVTALVVPLAAIIVTR